METAEKRDALKQCGVLATADADSLQWLADIAQADVFEPDQVVFAEGESSSRVYVVAWGSLQVRLSESSKLVSFAEPGSLFGEYAMFAKGVRTAHVVAAEASALLSFRDDEFREFLLRCPTVMMQLLQTAVRRLHRAERQKR
jgi:CRP-like cAMP-binding protein